MTELMLSEACGFQGHDIMFSSNDTPPQEFVYADKLGAIINLDDFTHIECLEKTLGHIPETISCRFNPGGVFKISNDIMDNPGDAKYGLSLIHIFSTPLSINSSISPVKNQPSPVWFPRDTKPLAMSASLCMAVSYTHLLCVPQQQELL